LNNSSVLGPVQLAHFPKACLPNQNWTIFGIVDRGLFQNGPSFDLAGTLWESVSTEQDLSW
jgi:hypothetical protein